MKSVDSLQKQGLIYGLADFDTGEIRYVGQTIVNVQKRLTQHLSAARKGAPMYVARWLNTLPAKPKIIILEKNPVGGLDEAEKAWIALLRGMGCRLTNLTDGGEGVQGCSRGPLSEEHKTKIREATQTSEFRQRMSEIKKGSKHTQETKEKIRRVHLGKTVSEETREKLSKTSKGRVPSEETKAKISATLTGRVVSEEIRAKIGEGQKKRTDQQTPEYREKMRQLATGRTASQETRAKLSAAHKGIPQSLESRAKKSAALKGRIPWNKGLVKIELKECLNCGSEFTVTAKHKNRQTCSKDCAYELRSKNHRSKIKI